MKSSFSIVSKLAILSLLLHLSIGLNAKVNEYQYPETYLQYTPAVFMLVAGAIGADCEHDFSYRLLNTACVYAAQALVVYPLKWTVDERRPDGSAWNSFPSGHTAATFAGAEMIRMEYGNFWGGVFYTGALFTGVMRVVHQRHWWWDVAAGAVIGVASAHLGKLASDKISLALSPTSFSLTYNF
ncbi:MAG: phosphatase PAP2 family protein [Candidatus Cryptobacteroides sp.]